MHESQLKSRANLHDISSLKHYSMNFYWNYSILSAKILNLAAHKVVNKKKYGAPLNSVVNKYLLVTTKGYFIQKCKFCH